MNSANVKIKISGQGPLEATAPLFSNFLAISRVGGEVQCEFVFADINELANILVNKESPVTVEIVGEDGGEDHNPSGNVDSVEGTFGQNVCRHRKRFGKARRPRCSQSRQLLIRLSQETKPGQLSVILSSAIARSTNFFVRDGSSWIMYARLHVDV